MCVCGGGVGGLEGEEGRRETKEAGLSGSCFPVDTRTEQKCFGKSAQ